MSMKRGWVPRSLRSLMELLIVIALTLVWTPWFSPARAAVSEWEVTGSMVERRAGHTATLLPSGKILVSGGIIGNTGYLSSAELYDPGSETWTPTGSMTTGRYLHRATILSNGKVLVAGGIGDRGRFDNTSLSSAELYGPDRDTDSWAMTGYMTVARNGTATLLPNGKVLVVGGYNCDTWISEAELFDPGKGTWSATGPMASARQFHTATLLPNGKVLVAGGFDGSVWHSSAELYLPGTGAWSKTGPMWAARSDHTATLLENGKVLVAGGFSGSSGILYSAELYRPARTLPMEFNRTGRNDFTVRRPSNGTCYVKPSSGMAAMMGQ